jgi:hypothetical protein
MSDTNIIPNIDNIDLELIPYKNNNKSQIKKYHIIRKNGHTIKHRICNVFAPFGRQTSSDHKTNTTLKQHRLNVCFSKEQIQVDEFSNDTKISKNKIYTSYIELKRLITELEAYFGSFDDFSEYELMSNIIDRDIYGIVIRFHLKTNKGKTVTPFVQDSSEDIGLVCSDNLPTEWISFDKTKQFNFHFHPDSLWIDHKNKKYGISLMMDRVFQMI